jgi:hypothetical protein
MSKLFQFDVVFLQLFFQSHGTRQLLVAADSWHCKSTVLEDAVTMDISGEPGPEMGEPPPTWAPLFTPSSARIGNPFSPSARGGDSPIKRCPVAGSLRSAPNCIA